MTGYYTAGLLLCLIGEPHNYENCTAKRSSFAFPTYAMCMETLGLQLEMLPLTVDIEKVEVVEIKCVEWLPQDDGEKL